jgi:hypothetical protein
VFNRRQREFVRDLKVLKELPEFKRVMANLKCDYVDQSTFNSDPLTMAYLNGKRDVIASLISSLEIDEEVRDINNLIKDGDNL